MGRGIERFLEEAWRVQQERFRAERKHREFNLEAECERLFQLLAKDSPESYARNHIMDLYSAMKSLPGDLSKTPGFHTLDRKIVAHVFLDHDSYSAVLRTTTDKPSPPFGAITKRNGTEILYNATGDYAKFKIFIYVNLLSGPRPFLFHFRLGRISDLQNFEPGYRIGQGKLYAFPNLHPSIRKGINLSKADFISFSQREDVDENQRLPMEHLSPSDYADLLDYENDVFMRIEVASACGKVKASQIASAEVKRSISIMKLFYGVPGDQYGGSAEEKFELAPLLAAPFEYYDGQEYDPENEAEAKLNRRTSFSRKTGGLVGGRDAVLAKVAFKREPHFDGAINAINKILDNHQRALGALEESIMNAFDIFGLIDGNMPAHVRLMLCIVTLEGLLIKGKQDNIGYKLAEKMALLLGDTIEWRELFDKISNSEKESLRSVNIETEAKIALARQVSKLYDQRSGFAHSGNDPRRAVTSHDYLIASKLVRMAIQRLLYLYDDGNGITEISKNSLYPERSLDYYLEHLKYGGTKKM